MVDRPVSLTKPAASSSTDFPFTSTDSSLINRPEAWQDFGFLVDMIFEVCNNVDRFKMVKRVDFHALGSLAFNEVIWPICIDNLL